MRNIPIKKNQIINLFNILWWLLVFLVCTMSSDKVPNPGLSIPHLDKVVHALLFGGVAFLFYARMYEMKPVHDLGKKIIAIISATLFGAFIEIIQPLYFNRGQEWMDLLADGIGAIIAVLLAKQGIRILNRLFTLLNIKL